MKQKAFMGGSFLRIGRVFIWLLLFGVGLAVSLAIGLLVTWQVVVAGLVGGPQDSIIVSVAGVVTALLLLMVHELGHAVVGWLAGMPPVSLTLVFLRVEWYSGRPRVLLNTQLFRPAALARHSAPGVSRGRLAAFVAGGPAASVVAGVACLALAQILSPGPPDVPAATRDGWRNVALIWPGSAVVSWLNLSGLVSLYIGGGTLIPGRSAGVRTDGGQLLDLAFGGGDGLANQGWAKQKSVD